jgi:uncharacterized membrane protein YdjX (TVP38/TMEM64 family)
MSDSSLPTEGRAGAGKSRSARRLRLLALAALIGAVVAVSRHYGLASRATVAAVRDTVDGTGPWGAWLYLALFAVRDFLRVPAFILVGAAVLGYGPVRGGLLGYAGVNLADAVSFLVARAVGGRPLADLDRPRLRRLLERLDRRPVLVVFTLRHLFFSFSLLNVLLALSRIRFRDYMIGTLLGLVIPTAGSVVLWMLVFAGWLDLF